MEQKICQIEHHAVLYGLLAKFAMDQGDAGHKAMIAATRKYGLERGKRMARHAKQEGIICCGETYPIFKEWRPSYPGQMLAGTTYNLPHCTTTVKRCEWVESWEKHELLAYGKLYCQYIDENLYNGYQSIHRLSVHSLLSAGDSCCTFDWGYHRPEDADPTIEVQQKEIGEKYIRNFNFHCGDLLHKISMELTAHLADTGVALCLKALKQFIEIYGKGYYRVMLEEIEREGWNRQLPWLYENDL